MMIKHSIFSILLLLLGLGAAPTAIAEDIAIIAHVSNKHSIQLEDIAQIFLGKQHRLQTDGEDIVPIHLPSNDPLYQAFAEHILKKSTSQLNAYWAKRIFTGKGTPPENMKSRTDAKTKVSQNPNLLAYIGAGDIDDTVRTILIFRIE